MSSEIYQGKGWVACLLVRAPDGKSSFELSIVPIERIKPHEKTIPSLLDSVERDMARTGFQRDPLLVDKETELAMDGMHRRAALADLGAKFAVCSEFDYFSTSVKLERWLRYFIAPSEAVLSEISSIFHLKQCSNFREAVGIVDSRESEFALLSAGESYVSIDRRDVLDVYRDIGKVDKICEDAKIDLQFAMESDKFSLFTSESVYVLYPAALTKKDVVRLAEKNQVFPYKTTRHIVPVRPMGIYFPLELLRNGSKSDCENKLAELVNLSKIELERIDVWYEGRRYSEPLAIFRRGG